MTEKEYKSIIAVKDEALKLMGTIVIARDDEIKRLKEEKEPKMKRIETMTDEAKSVYRQALERATYYGDSIFDCLDKDSERLKCSQCPFFSREEEGCVPNGSRLYRTAEEWRAWAEEEV